MFENEKFDEILNILRSGGTILFPSDTIWGIGCDATNNVAVDKILKLKNRTKDQGLVSLVSSVEMLKKYVVHVHPRIETLLLYHTRPVTVVYNESHHIASHALSKNGSVAIRVVQDAFCRELIEQFGKPIIATSANIHGTPFPKNFKSVSSEIIEGVDWVVKFKHESNDLSEPSVIVRLNDNEELDFIRE